MLQVHGSRARARDILFDAQGRALEVSGDCSSPVEVRYRGAPDKLLVNLGIEKEGIAVAYIRGRCRKCDECLNHRRRLWTARAIDECAAAPRSWFGTLTLAPMRRVSYLDGAQLRNEAARGDSWDIQPDSERFRKLCEQVHPDVTKFLKRVRKNAETSFRYLLVTEAHADGYPHFHMVLHESGTPIRKRVLDAAWQDGFSQWRLIPVGDPKGAAYACKYLSKSALTRVRASQSYGQAETLIRLYAERLEGASAVLSHLATEAASTGPVPKASNFPVVKTKF